MNKMNRTEINGIVAIYNHLIDLATKNLDKDVTMEWGKWKPTLPVLNILVGRRDKIKAGALNTEYKLLQRLNKGAHNE